MSPGARYLVTGPHRRTPHPSDQSRCIAVPATIRTTRASYLGVRATKQQAGRATLALGHAADDRRRIAGKVKNIHSSGLTTALAGIGTVTTDGALVTQEYRGRIELSAAGRMAWSRRDAAGLREAVGSREP